MTLRQSQQVILPCIGGSHSCALCTVSMDAARCNGDCLEALRLKEPVGRLRRRSEHGGRQEERAVVSGIVKEEVMDESR